MTRCKLSTPVHDGARSAQSGDHRRAVYRDPSTHDEAVDGELANFSLPVATHSLATLAILEPRGDGNETLRVNRDFSEVQRPVVRNS